MKNTKNKARFKTRKAYIMLGLVLVILSLLSINLLSHPRGTSLVEEYPTALHDDTSSTTLITTDHN